MRVNRGVILMMHFLKRRSPFNSDAGRDQLLERLKLIEGIDLRGGVDGMPRVPFAALTNARALAVLLETLDWLVEQIRSERGD